MGPGRAFPEGLGGVESPFFGGIAGPYLLGLQGRFGEGVMSMVGHDMEKIGVLDPDEMPDVEQFIRGDEPIFGKGPCFFSIVCDHPYHPL